MRGDGILLSRDTPHISRNINNCRYAYLYFLESLHIPDFLTFDFKMATFDFDGTPLGSKSLR